MAHPATCLFSGRSCCFEFHHQVLPGGAHCGNQAKQCTREQDKCHRVDEHAPVDVEVVKMGKTFAVSGIEFREELFRSKGKPETEKAAQGCQEQALCE